MKHLESHYNAGGEANGIAIFGKNSFAVSYIFKPRTNTYPAIPLLGICIRYMKSYIHTEICIWI